MGIVGSKFCCERYDIHGNKRDIWARIVDPIGACFQKAPILLWTDPEDKEEDKEEGEKNAGKHDRQEEDDTPGDDSTNITATSSSDGIDKISKGGKVNATGDTYCDDTAEITPSSRSDSSEKTTMASI